MSKSLFICSRRRILLAGLFAWVCSGVSAAGQAPAVRILFLGNSYTSYNELPEMVEGILQSSRVLSPQISSHMKGGYRLEQHAEDPEALSLLKRGARDGNPWDVIVVQEQSVLSAQAATDARGKQMMHGGMTRLVRAAYEVNPRILVIDFQIWARDPKLWKQGSEEALATGADAGKAFENIRRANAEAVAAAQQQVPEAHIVLSPVGEFWKLSGESLPDLKLYDEDGSHPTRAGTYLAGLVIAGSIGGRGVIESTTWLGKCPESQAKRLKQLVLEHPEVFKTAGK